VVLTFGRAGWETVTGTIHAVLDRLRDEALDERDKGSKFEQLIGTGAGIGDI
jgi:hypothetical protein